MCKNKMIGLEKKEHRIEQARNYVQMAWADYVAAMASSVPYSICFHAQQETEKMVKAFLLYCGVKPPRVHDIEKLLSLGSIHNPEFLNFADDAQTLEPYSVNVRYDVSKDQAERECSVVWAARTRLVGAVTSKLPKEVLEATGY